MIVILGYDSFDNDFLISILNDLQVEFKQSLRERDIIKANKIILPHPLNLNQTYRKLSIMNINSVLKMVNIPLLGINDGMRIMCKNFEVGVKGGLGLFDIDIFTSINPYLSQKLYHGNLGIICSTNMIESKYQDYEIFFDNEVQPPISQYTSVKIKSDRGEFSLLYEYQNYTGLVINISRNEQIYREFIINFTKQY